MEVEVDVSCVSCVAACTCVPCMRSIDNTQEKSHVSAANMEEERRKYGLLDGDPAITRLRTALWHRFKIVV
jgi:hypothetical protein